MNIGAAPGRISTNASLKSRTIQAAIWVATGSVGANIIRLLSNLVLTRLLFPEAFGLMMMATTVAVIMAMLSDVGIHQSIIRGERGDDPLYLDTAWTFQIVRGVVLCLAASGLAVVLHFATSQGLIPVASAYADPLLPWIIAATSFGAVIQGFQSTDLASANRHLNIKPLIMLEFATQLFGVVLMIGMAWWLRSVWALVISGLVVTLVNTLASHKVLRFHRNRLRVEQKALRELFVFGKWIVLSSAVSVFVINGDRLILGALVGMQVLGLFSIAITLAGALDVALGSLSARVILPVLSEIVRKQPDRLSEAFYRLRWRIDPLVLVAGGALFALGPFIIGLLYDERYQDAGHMLQILSLGLVVGRLSMAQQVYLALNEPRYQVALNLVRAVSLYIAVPVAFHFYGLNGALLTIALRELAPAPLIFWFNARHGVNNVKLELLWLLFWPIGWILGTGLLAVHSFLARS